MMMNDSISREFMGRMLFAIAVVGWMSGMALGQEADREALAQPVYRVLDGAAPAPTASPAPSRSPGSPPRIANQPAAQAQVAALAPKTAMVAEVASNISEPQRILNEALVDAAKSLDHIRTRVNDYTCLLVKREKVNGSILPPEFIEAKVRHRKIVDGKTIVPFSVYMRFLKPQNMKGREVLFVEGQNNDMMRVREGGAKGRFLPSVWLKPHGPLAMQTNRYPISEVGVENLAVRLIDRAKADTSIDECIVTYRGGAKIDGRACKFLEVKRPQPKTGDALKHGMNVYLAHVFIDEEFNFPIRYAAYEWPEEPKGRPPVVEEYTYQNVKVNVGLTDLDFDPSNPKYSF